MVQRANWQYCQVEVGGANQGVLRQFFADRDPVEMQLYANWSAMIGKLGDQGWELVSVVTGVGKNSVIYVFKRPANVQVAGTAQGMQGTSASPPSSQPAHPQQPFYQPPAPPEEDEGPGFEPLRGL